MVNFLNNNIDFQVFEDNAGFSDSEIQELLNFIYIQGLPESELLPADFVLLLKMYGHFEVTLLDEDDDLKYVQIGGSSAKELLADLNDWVLEYLSHPSLAIGINGMGQTLFYIYKDNKFGLYILQDGDFLDDEFVYLSDSLLTFLETKVNLDKLS